MENYVVIDGVYYELPNINLVKLGTPDIEKYFVQEGNKNILRPDVYSQEEIYPVLKRLDETISNIITVSAHESSNEESLNSISSILRNYATMAKMSAKDGDYEKGVNCTLKSLKTELEFYEGLKNDEFKM